jgi:hypothetical protein
MDKERARFVLRSFRPDGADSDDVDFAEALRFATNDRELGEWLMRERAFDAEFAEALARVELPEGLREKVFLAMVQDRGGFPKADSAFDAAMIASIGAIKVPEGLRENVIEAMERTAKVERGAFGWKRVGIPLAAAAGIALAFLLADGGQSENTVAKPVPPVKIGIESVQAGFVRIHDSPTFSIDQVDGGMPHLISHLRAKGLPCGGGYLPPGLEGVRSLGCRELVIDGKRGSLICFDTESGTVHLVIFRRTDVSDELPEMEQPVIEQSGSWAKAHWRKEKYAFSLMAMRDRDSLAGFF